MSTPLTLTQAVHDVSVTERNGFKACRRRWVLEVLENLEPKGMPQWALEFGTGIHLALEDFYEEITLGKGKKAEKFERALENAKVKLREWHDEVDERFKEEYDGLVYESASSELWQMFQLGCTMLDNYATFAKEKDTFKVLAIEGQVLKPSPALKIKSPYGPEAAPIHHESGRILTPIVDPVTKKVIQRPYLDPETGEIEIGPVYLSGKLDLIVQETSPQFKGLWVMDHKTTSGQISDRGLDFDDQITGYCYIMWRLTGKIPRGVMFNYLVKREPNMPRILKDGSLSTAKDQGTLPHLYKEALKEHGLMKGGRVSSVKHAEALEAYLAQGWNQLFQRFRPQRNAHELEMFERRLIEEATDMQIVRDNPEKAYPHLSSWHCGYCSVSAICNAMEKGEDVESVKTHMFQQAIDRKA